MLAQLFNKFASDNKGVVEWGSAVSWSRSLKVDLLVALAVADIWGFLPMALVSFSMLLAKPQISATLPLQV